MRVPKVCSAAARPGQPSCRCRRPLLTNNPLPPAAAAAAPRPSRPFCLPTPPCSRTTTVASGPGSGGPGSTPPTPSGPCSSSGCCRRTPAAARPPASSGTTPRVRRQAHARRLELGAGVGMGASCSAMPVWRAGLGLRLLVVRRSPGCLRLRLTPCSHCWRSLLHPCSHARGPWPPAWRRRQQHAAAGGALRHG